MNGSFRIFLMGRKSLSTWVAKSIFVRVRIKHQFPHFSWDEQDDHTYLTEVLLYYTTNIFHEQHIQSKGKIL